MTVQPDDNDTLTKAIDRLALALDKTRAELENAQRIPTFEVESGVNANVTADGSGLIALTVTPNTSNIFLVRSVTSFIPVGASGLVVLGGAQIPVGAGTVTMRLFLPLNPDDIRQLQSTVAGTMSLVITGEQLSRRMMFR